MGEQRTKVPENMQALAHAAGAVISIDEAGEYVVSFVRSYRTKYRAAMVLIAIRDHEEGEEREERRYVATRAKARARRA